MRSTLILLLLYSFSECYAQNGAVKGSISDLFGKPIANAHVYLENTAVGVSTDINGIFLITDIPSGLYIINFSAIGYKLISKSIDVKPGEIKEVNFIAEENVIILEEVKVSGIKSITGMGYLNEAHDGVIFSGKKTEVLLLDSLDANTAQNNPRQVLGRVPGANYSETDASGFPSNGIGFRGLTPTQSVETNTRQNGYNITADLYGYPESYYLPPLETVERIEVIRGASSLQFGPQFGGVINYIMKKGSTKKPIEIFVQQTEGSFGMHNSFGSIGGQSNKFNYYGSLQFQTASGWRPNSDYQKITGFGRVEFQATEKIKLGIEYSILRNRIHMPGGLTDSMFYLNSRASYRSRNWIKTPWNILTAIFSWKITPCTSLNIKSTYNSSARDLVWRNEDGGPGALDEIDPLTSTYVNREVEHESFKSYTTEARLLKHYKVGNTHNSLATGARFFSGKMKRQGGGEGTTGKDFDLSLATPGFEYDLDFTTTNFAPFIENTFRFGEKLSVTPGFRYEFIRSTIKGFNPSEIDASIVYSNQSRDRHIFLSGIGVQFNTSNSTNIYANWSQAYRPMDYSSLKPLGTIVTVDPNLKDANGYNADLGFRGSVKDYLNFDVSGFYLQYNNRIGLIERTDANGTYPYRTNVANSIHQGVESYVEFNPVKAFVGHRKWGMSFFNSFALINAKYVSGDFNGKYVEYAPTTINRFGISGVIGKFSTTFLISNTAKSYSDAGNSQTPSADGLAGAIPAYTVLDWSGTIHVKNYSFKFGVNNLSDSHYFTLRTGEYPGPGIIPSIGRSIYVSIGAKF
jgi:Fe(3+) dicitrate transport protein